MANTSANDLRFVAQSCDRLAQFMPEFIEIVTTDILEFDLLEILPDAFNRVEIGRIAWQSHNLDVGGRTLSQEPFHLAIMDRGTIPNNQQLGSDLAAQVLEKHNHISTGKGTMLTTQIQLAGWCNRADD